MITSTLTGTHLERSELWTNDLKKPLEDMLMMRPYVRWLTDFPDGQQLTIPSIGNMTIGNYTENESVQFQALDTGEFTFNITEYLQNGIYITNKAKQDSYYASQLIATFVPSMQRALDERLEADILKQGQPGVAGGQTHANPNLINGAAHRWVGGGTLNSKKVVDLVDYAKAWYSFDKANVPQSGRIAIVDPANAYYLSTLANLVNVSNNPQWTGVITEALTQGMRFVKNVYGFDVYTSNRLALCGANQAGTSETINSVASGANAVCNIFFSTDASVTPFIGAWRQMPVVESTYSPTLQREEYVLTARYGLKLYRPENFITVLSDPTAVTF